MATLKQECIICFSGNEDIFLCVECKESACVNCLLQYKKLECPNCFAKYNDVILKDYFTIFKDIYINYYIYNEIKFDNQTNSKLLKYFKEEEIKKIVFEGNKKFIQGIVKKNDKILKCKKCNSIVLGEDFCKNCVENSYIGTTGILTCKKCLSIIKPNGICCKCGYRICLKCEETYHNDVDCDEMVLKNLNEVKKTCKKCPSCFSYITRTQGCSHMLCSYCGATFDWNNPETIQKDKYLYMHKEKSINTTLNNNYEEKYEMFFKKNDLEELKIKEIKNDKKTLKVITNTTSEEILSFVSSINKNFKKNEANLKKLTIEYFILIKKICDENKDKILSQLEMNSLIEKKFMKKLYYSLKKQEYYIKINECLSNNEIQSIKNIYQNLKDIHFTSILPKKILFSINKETSKIETEITKVEKKKIKENILYGVEDEDEFNCYPIKLLNIEQVIHVENIINILKKYNLCLNTSYPGSGKTYTSLYTANELKIKNIILFCPKIMKDKWLKIIKEYNSCYKFDIYIFTYSELSSPYFNLNNNIFSRETENDKIIINLDKEFKKKINNKTMIIYDEVHNLKSPSSIAFKFISTLSNFGMRKKSYILALSATPVEKSGEIKHLIKKLSYTLEFENVDIRDDEFMIYNIQDDEEPPKIEEMCSTSTSIIKKGINSNNKIYTKFLSHINKPGFRNEKKKLINIIKNFKTYNIALEKEFTEILNPNDNNYFLNNIVNICINIDIEKLIKYAKTYNYTTFISICIHLINSAFNLSLNLTRIVPVLLLLIYGIDLKWSYNFLKKKDFSDANKTLQEMFFKLKMFNIESCVKKNDICELKNLKLLEIDLKSEDKNILRTSFEQVLIKIDNELSISTLETFALITKGLMVTELLYISYITEIISTIYKKNIKIIIGMHFKETIVRFKKGFEDMGLKTMHIDGSVKDKVKVVEDFTNNEIKILLVNLKSLNSGIDLDDKLGNQPRVVFIIPDFKFGETIQFMYRFKRIDSKSEPYIFLLNNHVKIFKKLLEKNNVMQRLDLNLPNISSLDIINQDNIKKII